MSGKIITSRRPCPTTPPCELEDLIGYPYDIPSRCVATVDGKFTQNTVWYYPEPKKGKSYQELRRILQGSVSTPSQTTGDHRPITAAHSHFPIERGLD